MAKKKTDNEFLRLARERFEDAKAGEQDIRELSDHDIKFDNGEQWTDAEKIERKGRPCPVINKVSGTNKQILGDARQNRPRIKVRPVDSSSDPFKAEILTGLIRNIENVSDAESAYDYGHECSVRGGYGHWRVLTEYSDDSFDQEIRIKRLHNPFSVFFDPASVEQDYSDAKYCFITDELTKEEFETQYPDADFVDWENSETHKDNWINGDRITIAEYFYKEPAKRHLFEFTDGRVIEVNKPEMFDQPETPPSHQLDQATGQIIETPGQPASKWVYGEGFEQPLQYKRERVANCEKVKWCKLSGSQVLEGPQDWAGKYIPVIRELGEEIWIDGKRVLRSATRQAIDPQRLYNWGAANAIEVLALGPKQPYLMTGKQVEGYESEWERAFRRPSSYLRYNPDPQAGGPPQRQSLDVSTAGITNFLMVASDDIKSTTGLFDASLGKQGNETSGRAIIARQREGDTATFVFSDNQVKAIRYTGKILVDLIPKIYDTERVVRLMGDDLKKSMGQGQQQQQITVAPDGMSAWVKVNIVDPATGKVIANDLSLGKYDVVVDAGPGYMTRRIEAADGMVQLAQAAPQLMPVLVPRVAKNLDWPDSQEIAEEIKQLTQPQQPPPDPRIQLEMEKGKLDLQGKQLDNQGKVIDIQSRAQANQQAGAEGEQKMAQIAQAVVVGTLRQLGMIR
jgi:hypothetical protein